MDGPVMLKNGSGDLRQKALQEELTELVDVVGPGSLVDLLLERAFQLRATDIHFDPTETGLRIRLRVDGILHDILQLSNDVTSHVISRLKLMANMDITERRLAQDGHFTNTNITLQHQRDVRVGTGPTIYGERMVLRLMPDNNTYRRLEELGLDDHQIGQVRRFVMAPYGMVLSVGPVGSGKTTTIYSCLELLNDPGKSLVTIEDPVERRFHGVNQIQVDPKIDFNFVRALRGVLRQDPDVMMIGEIRDPETAQIGIRAGLTGVTVLSTMHSHDTASTIDAFREFDIPQIFVADSVQGIISQRLLRKVCPHCRTTFTPDAGTCQFLGIDPAQAQDLQFAKGQGCEACFQTGYFGRTGVFEIMSINGDIRAAILQGKSRNEVMQIARSHGMQPLEEAAKQKVLAGITTVEEVHRVLTSFPV